MTGANPIAMILQKIMQQNAQQPMSEQMPGGGTPTMPSPMVMPQMQRSAMPQAPQMQSPQIMQNAAPIFGQQPNATAEATQGPTKMPRPVMPGDIGQTEWSTKAGRNMAITGSAIQSFSNAFQAGQQKNWERTAAQSEQLFGSYLAMQKALADAQDPASKKAIQQQLQQMMDDPKTQKILKKAHSDPTSPEGVGLQRSMKMQQQQAEAQVKLAQAMSEIQKNQAQAALQQSQVPRNDEERAVAMGMAPTADAKVRIQEMAEAKKQEIEYKRDKLQQDYQLTQERLADKRASDQERFQLMRELGQQRIDMTRMMMEWRMQQAQEKSKIPAGLLSRYSQAQIMKEQISDMRKQLDDPELQKYMGPTKGWTTGLAARLFGNRKVQDFFTSQQSLDALMPLLHGYRGGAQTHAVFQRAMGTLSIDPNSYKGSLDATERMVENVLKEGQQQFPNDPFWKMPMDKMPDSTSTSGKKPDIVVTPEDMK